MRSMLTGLDNCMTLSSSRCNKSIWLLWKGRLSMPHQTPVWSTPRGNSLNYYLYRSCSPSLFHPNLVDMKMQTIEDSWSHLSDHNHLRRVHLSARLPKYYVKAGDQWSAISNRKWWSSHQGRRISLSYPHSISFFIYIRQGWNRFSIGSGDTQVMVISGWRVWVVLGAMVSAKTCKLWMCLL